MSVPTALGPTYEHGTPLIPAAHQPALLIDHLQALDLDPALALSDTGLRATDLAEPDCLLTPRQYARLLHNGARALGGSDASFVLGQQALPGHFGAASHALLRAPTLRRALAVLVAHPARLSPLIAPHLVVEERVAVLYWTDTGAAAASLRPFLVELHMSAVKSLCDWLAGARLPWHYCFNRTAPRDTEPHAVHLGTRLRFGCQIDAMRIDPDWLDRPFAQPRGAASAALHDALDRESRAEDARASLLGRLYDRLLAQVHRPPGLDATAAEFGLSPATFKRRLASHGTHFQAELDQARLHATLQLIHCRGWDNEAVARHLGFHDPTNFRRSLKRWSGLTPSLLRDQLGSAEPAAS